MGKHMAPGAAVAPLRVGAAAVLALLVGGLLLHDALGPETPESKPKAAELTGLDAPAAGAAAQSILTPQTVVRGDLLLRKGRNTTPKGPLLLPESAGRIGTGTATGAPSEVAAPVGPPITGVVRAAVANLPDRTPDGPFAGSMSTLASSAPDFILLQEVPRHSTEQLKSLAPGYDAYRDEDPDGAQSLNNVVMWRDSDYTLVDAGRVKLLNDDRGFLHGHAFTWDRYATWAMLQRADGAIVSVISTHLPTNPRRYPQQHGNPGMSRATLYGTGMDVLRQTVQVLSQHGPVLVGGDMNSHPSDGSWAAAPKMTALGYGYAKDNGVMYLFYPPGVGLVSNSVVNVASDHPAIVTTLDLGTGPAA